ncbi:WD40/YVTN/BNR-like repeat-containing protein [Pseudomonas sp. N040]|uniref:WD40/YVTN/BNR-like repeat-containing protein n=1 Tax=Pseudomonas sp. N040 TaxID=2785325 RepID=UPI0018A32D7F|nr:YCF48-related protein [Pseudomonas sp. N040]MBF7729760.1 glycosyl hydrolase [Pseudomonas sp. N040]MBW7013402.1 glycosyl hydrolase [Pseudomonas sp. N040]
MYFSKRLLLSALCSALFMQQGTIQAAEYADVLETPALMSQIAIKGGLNGVTSAGSRLVAVGLRGHILYSDDAGKTWLQAKVPLSSDLTAVHFPTPSEGWAVGHDGVVLHTSDAGATWTKQLDGTQTGKIMLEYYTRLAATDPANEQFATLVADAQRMADEGADKPFMSVWFADNQNGYIVGAFGMAFQTKDGGASWTPINEKVDNPQALHLNAITGFGTDGVIAVSEQGSVLQLDPASGNFAHIKTPYDGTYFGVLATKNNLIIYGLRGMAFRSNDGGTSWNRIVTPVKQTFTAATVDDAGQVFLFTQPGHVLKSTDGGVTFEPVPQASLSPVSGAVAAGDKALVLVGPRGVRVFPVE